VTAPLRAILFDLGDTLIDFEPMDTRGVFREAARQTYDFLRNRGFEPPPFETYCRRQFQAVRWAYFWAKLRRREFNSLQILRSFCDSVGASLSDADLHELAWLWYAPLVEHSGVEEGLADTLATLRDRGYRLGLVSNTFVDGAIHDRHLALHGLLDFFPVRVYSSAVGYRKPDPRIFRTALDRLNVTASEAMFVGDLVKTDIVGARRAGMVTVLKLPWGGARAGRVADFVIRQVSDLPDVLTKFDRTGTSEDGDSPLTTPAFAE
jgi:putative hydrolase of the HAD superfamily